MRNRLFALLLALCLLCASLPPALAEAEPEQEDFLAQAESLCDDLKSTLDRILLYREENAYKVCHRINAINRLARELRRIADTL